MEESLKAQIHEDMKAAMRAKDSHRLGTIRMLMAAVKQKEIDERIILDNLQIIAVIDKMIKQRRESFEQFKNAGRIDLADKESSEIEILKAYLPQPLSEAEITQLIATAINEVGATAMSDMGKVMALIRPQAQGRADIGKISAQVKVALTK